jgi:hypothetical protein
VLPGLAMRAGRIEWEPIPRGQRCQAPRCCNKGGDKSTKFGAASPAGPRVAQCRPFARGLRRAWRAFLLGGLSRTLSGTSTISHLPSGHVSVRALNASAGSVLI